MTAPRSDPSSRQPSLARPAAWAALVAPLVAAGIVALARGSALGRGRNNLLAGVHVTLLIFGIIAAVVALASWRRRPARGVLMPAVVGLLLSAVTLTAVAYALLRPGRPAPLAPAAWRPYASPEGRFSVLLPAPPTEKSIGLGAATTQPSTLPAAGPDTQPAIQPATSPATEPATRPLGRMLTRQVYTLLPEGSTFAVTWFDPPGATDRPAANEVLLNALADQRARGGRLLSQRSITLDGYPGRELRLEMATRHGPVLLISRDYLIRGRLYQVMAEVPRDRATQRMADVANFFDSFHAKGAR